MKVKNFPKEYATNRVYFLSNNFNQQNFRSLKLLKLKWELEFKNKII